MKMKLHRGTILAICALLILGVLVFTGHNYHSSKLTEHGKIEAILGQKMDSLNKALNFISKAHENLTLQYTMRGDSVKQIASKALKTRIIYREARTVTDSDSTAENVASELRSARGLIIDQERHINGLLALNIQADSLLAVRLDIIANQSDQIQTLSNMFANAKAEGKEEVKQERKKGNRKLLKGMAIGGAVVALLVLL